MEQTNNFSRAILFIGDHEWSGRNDGAYTDDPNDPGGETRWGISKRAYPNLDIKNLSFEQATDIYAKDYWDACGCDAIPFPDCVAVFDTAVNCGVSRAKGWLKSSNTIKDFLQLRINFYTKIVSNNPSEQKYLGGWIGRVNDLKKYLDINSTTE